MKRHSRQLYMWAAGFLVASSVLAGLTLGLPQTVQAAGSSGAGCPPPTGIQDCITVDITLTGATLSKPATVHLQRVQALSGGGNYDNSFDLISKSNTSYTSGNPVYGTNPGFGGCIVNPLGPGSNPNGSSNTALFNVTVSGSATGTLDGINLCANQDPKPNSNDVKAFSVPVVAAGAPPGSSQSGGITGTIVVAGAYTGGVTSQTTSCPTGDPVVITGPTNLTSSITTTSGAFNTGLVLQPGTYTVVVSCSFTGQPIDTKTFTGVKVTAGQTTNLGSTTCVGSGAGGNGCQSPVGAGVGVPDPVPPNPPEECDAASFTWLLCPAIDLLNSGITIAEEQIKNFLTVTPLSGSTNAPLEAIWSAFRTIADIFFIVIFFAVVLGTAFGLDAYTVKSMLPRLVGAGVLIQFSFLICGLLIDAANVAGLGVNGLFATLNISRFGGSHTSPALMSLGAIGDMLAFGTAGAVALASGAFFPVILFIVGAFLAVVAVFITLEIRLMLIDFLVVMSPFAFILWVLPNTHKWFTRWWKAFTSLLIMFPMIMVLFAVAALFSNTSASGGGCTAAPGAANAAGCVIQHIFGSLAPIIAFFLVPTTFKYSIKALSATSDWLQGQGRQAHGGVRGMLWGSERQADSRTKGTLRYGRLQEQTPTGLFGRAARRAGMATASVQGGIGGHGELASLRRQQALNKARQEHAAAQALGQSQRLGGRPSFEEEMASRQAAALAKQMGTKITQASQRAIDVRNAAGAVVARGVMGSIDLSPDAIRSLAATATAAFDSGDNATGIAAMQSLSRSAGGRDEMRTIRTSVFGGDDANSVNAAALNGQAGALWKEATAKVKPDSAPDLVVPPNAGFDGISAGNFVGMDKRTQTEYLRWASSDLNRIQSAADVINKAQATPTMASRLGQDNYLAMKTFADGVGAAVISSDVRKQIDAAKDRKAGIPTVVV